MKTINVIARTTVRPRVAIVTRSTPSMLPPWGVRAGGSGFESLNRPLEDLLDQAARIDFSQHPAVAVVLDQRRRLLFVRLDPLPHDLLLVIRADDQGRAALVAEAGSLRRIHEDVVHGVVLRAHPPAGVSFDQLLGLEEQAHDGVDLRELRQRLRLRDRPRESVEDESLLRVRLLEAAFRHRDHEIVGDQLARIHEGLRLLPEVRVLRDVVAQDVARRDARDPEVRRELLRLSAFARARRAEEDEAHQACENRSAVKRLWTKGPWDRIWISTVSARGASRRRRALRQSLPRGGLSNGVPGNSGGRHRP